VRRASRLKLFGSDFTQQAVEVFASTDHGATWSYRSSCASESGLANSIGHGIWEPEFTVAGNGSLVCYFSDERPLVNNYNQVLAHVVSTDGGRTWGAETYDVAVQDGVQRPGMMTVGVDTFLVRHVLQRRREHLSSSRAVPPRLDCRRSRRDLAAGDRTNPFSGRLPRRHPGALGDDRREPSFGGRGLHPVAGDVARGLDDGLADVGAEALLESGLDPLRVPPQLGVEVPPVVGGRVHAGRGVEVGGVPPALLPGRGDFGPGGAPLGGQPPLGLGGCGRGVPLDLAGWGFGAAGQLRGRQHRRAHLGVDGLTDLVRLTHPRTPPSR